MGNRSSGIRVILKSVASLIFGEELEVEGVMIGFLTRKSSQIISQIFRGSRGQNKLRAARCAGCSPLPGGRSAATPKFQISLALITISH
jgi:hypothetical protein